MEKKQFLDGVIVYILEQGVNKTRRGILTKQVETHGGGVATNISHKNITHIIVGSNVKPSRLLQLLKVDSILQNVDVVYADWLSDSLVAGQQLQTSLYSLKPAEVHVSLPKRSCDQTTEEKSSKKIKIENDQSDSTCINKGDSPSSSSTILKV